jgi:hypothetical protein
MGDDPARFRARAIQCRVLAGAAHDVESRRSLSEMAQELEDEADKIEAEDAERGNDA